MGTAKKKNKIHYAWIVLAGCVLIFFVIAGLSGNCYSVYSPFIMNEYGFSKTQISLIGSVGSLAATLSVFLTTPFYKRVSLRNGILLAGLMNAAAYGLFSLADNYPMFLLASCVKGFSYGLGSMVPISMIVTNWFKTGRTLALSIVSAASGLATIGVPSLITWVIQKYNFHVSFLASAIAFAALYFLAWLLIRNKPENMGLAAYEGEEKKKAGKEPEEDKPVRTLSNRWWWLLTIAIIAATCVVTCFSNLSMLSSTEGIEPEIIAIVVSTAGAALMGGKLIYGVVATAIGQKKTSLLFGLVGVAGLASCCLIRLSTAFLFFGTVCIGVAASSLVVGSVSWVNDWAKPSARADHVKVFQSAYNAGCLVNGILCGLLADAFGGCYIQFYGISAGIMVLFVLVVNAAYRRQAEPRK